MSERTFADGVIVELPEGFEWCDATRLCDRFPRLVISVDPASEVGRRILESTLPSTVSPSSPLQAGLSDPAGPGARAGFF